MKEKKEEKLPTNPLEHGFETHSMLRLGLENFDARLHKKEYWLTAGKFECGDAYMPEAREGCVLVAQTGT